MSFDLDFLTVIESDAVQAELELGTRTDYSRRNYIRAFFANVEGISFTFKQVALQEAATDPALFSHAEIALLREESYDLNAKGEVLARTKFLRTDDNVRFSFTSFARAHHVAYQFPSKDAEWELFRRSLAVRHRLTHPKSLQDLQVTEYDLAVVRRAAAWFKAEHGRLLGAVLVQLRQTNAELSAMADEPEASSPLHLVDNVSDSEAPEGA